MAAPNGRRPDRGRADRRPASDRRTLLSRRTPTDAGSRSARKPQLPQAPSDVVRVGGLPFVDEWYGARFTPEDGTPVFTEHIGQYRRHRQENLDRLRTGQYPCVQRCRDRRRYVHRVKRSIERIRSWVDVDEPRSAAPTTLRPPVVVTINSISGVMTLSSAPQNAVKPAGRAVDRCPAARAAAAHTSPAGVA